jgi:hypothetical protein
MDMSHDATVLQLAEKGQTLPQLKKGKPPICNSSVESLNPTFKRRYEMFGPIGGCRDGLKKYGSKTDGHKWLCGVDATLQQDGCVIYSIGSNNEFDFEESMLRSTACDIHTFDCTVVPELKRIQGNTKNRVKFHKWCLSDRNFKDENGNEFFTLPSVQAKLGHDKIDLLKMDIEGWEWGVYSGFKKFDKLPYQITTELHLTAFWNSAGDRGTGKLPWAGRAMSLAEAAAWGRRFYDLGYVAVSHDWSERWPQSREFTFVRMWC